MNIEISGRNFEVTDRIRTLITSKLDTITKYFHDIIEVRCVLNVEKYRNICEIFVLGKEHDVKSVQEAETMEEAIQSTVDHLKRQAQKSREKIRDHRRGSKQSLLPESWQVNVLERGRLRDDALNGNRNSPRIIKTNNLPIRPMSIEQAALMLDSSKNEFIVFQDVDTEKVTVIYKRTDNNFGMIAPEF
jgi:putative sigma-54 modulation protein